MTKKYKLDSNDTITVNGKTLYRIIALINFADVAVGDKGGYIESENNLSHDGDAWVGGNAQVFGNAKIYGDAKIYGNACVGRDAEVFGKAHVYDNAKVYGHVKISDGAKVYGYAKINDNVKIFEYAKVYDHARVEGNAKIYGIANVFGCAYVLDNAKVYDCANVYGHSEVFDNAQVYGNGSKVYDNAVIKNDAKIYGIAEVFEEAHVYGKACIGGGYISGNVEIFGDALICRYAQISKYEDYFCVQSCGEEGKTITLFKKMMKSGWGVSYGSFDGTIEEFRKEVKKLYGDSLIAQEYLMIADLMELRIKRIKNK